MFPRSIYVIGKQHSFEFLTLQSILQFLWYSLWIETEKRVFLAHQDYNPVTLFWLFKVVLLNHIFDFFGKIIVLAHQILSLFIWETRLFFSASDSNLLGCYHALASESSIAGLSFCKIKGGLCCSALRFKKPVVYRPSYTFNNMVYSKDYIHWN